MMTTLLPPTTTIGTVALATPDLAQLVDFYRGTLGMQVLKQDAASAVLGAPGAASGLVRLIKIPPPTSTRKRTAGLYHMAIRLPNPHELALALIHLARLEYPLEGMADHGVSQSLYLTDPGGNGIELYCDRPEEEWPVDEEGALDMGVDELDIDALLEGIPETLGDWPGLPAGTVMGHIHLQVGDIAASERFYCEVLGFELVQRMQSSASFVAAGDYHHHVAFNIWGGANLPPAPPDAAGLRWFELRLPDTAALEAVLANLEAAGLHADATPAGPLVRDPARIGILLTER